MSILYIADWHYGHANILHFDNRPFKTCDDMNQALVDRWNAVVQPDDTVYVLGDMFWCKGSEAVEVLKQLKGQKHLIKGNHDRCHDTGFRKCFTSIKERDEVEDNGRHVIVDHFPSPYFQNHFYGWYHLYGHVHTSFEHNMALHDRYLMEQLYGKPCQMYNVGAMLPYMDYTPQTLDTIVRKGTLYYNSFTHTGEEL